MKTRTLMIGLTFALLTPVVLVSSGGDPGTAVAQGRSDAKGSPGRGRALGHDPEPRVIILETVGGVSHFSVTGSTDDFGRYLAQGEATFVAGQEEGVLLDGTGIAVVQAENGDQIVADVTCKVTDRGFDVTFHWRDSVTFSNGSTVSNSGEFVDHRPPGLTLTSTNGLSINDGTWGCTTVFEQICAPTNPFTHQPGTCFSSCRWLCCYGCYFRPRDC